MPASNSTSAELLITYLEVALSFIKIAEDTEELQHAVSACGHARDAYERVTQLLMRCDQESTDHSIVDALRIQVTDGLATLDASFEQRAPSSRTVVLIAAENPG